MTPPPPEFNLVIIAYEANILFYDLSLEKPALSVSIKDNLHGKQITQIQPIDSTYICFGCSDGSILVYSMVKRIVEKTIPKGYHSKGIAVTTSYSQDSQQRPRLIAGSLDGSLALWNIDTCDNVPTLRFQQMDPKTDRIVSNAMEGNQILSVDVNIET